MIRHLIISMALACLLLTPALCFADKMEEAQSKVLEASNLEAWQMLEDGTFGERVPDSPFAASYDQSQGNQSTRVLEEFDAYAAPASVPPQIPEPATMILLGMGLLGIGARRKWRK